MFTIDGTIALAGFDFESSELFLGIPPKPTVGVIKSLSLIESVDEMQEDGADFSFFEVGRRSNMSESSAMRWLKPEKLEKKSYSDILRLREELVHDYEPLLVAGAQVFTSIYHAQLTSNATIPIGWVDGEFYWNVNVSRFPFVQTVGRLYNWNVTWDAELRRPFVARRAPTLDGPRAVIV